MLNRGIRLNTTLRHMLGFHNSQWHEKGLQGKTALVAALTSFRLNMPSLEVLIYDHMRRLGVLYSSMAVFFVS